MNLRRILSAATLAVSLAGLTACTSSGLTSGGASPTPSTGLSAGPLPGSGAVSGSPGSSACDALTAADVQSALNESVTATNPLPGVSGVAGQLQECVLKTDGPPLAPQATATLKALAIAVMGDAASNLDLSTGGIVVVSASTPLSVTASPTALPSGVTAVPGIGQQAYVAAVTPGGGLAFAQLTPNSAVLILDVEGKQVTEGQLTALLTAAAS
jgi:hypothetical protein